MTINPDEEQAKEPSSEEKKETSKEEQVTKPSDSRDRFEKFAEKQAEKKEAKSKETSKEKEIPSEKEAGKKVEDSKPKVSKIRFVDEEGKDASLVLTVDGKEYEIKDPEELRTKGQIWYHHDIKGAELNAKEKELQTGAEQLAKIMEAIEKRASESAPKKPSEEEQVEEEDEDEDILDPEVREKFKAIKKELKEVKGESGMVKQILLNMLTTNEGSRIDEEIKTLQEDGFSLAKRKSVYRLLAENDEKTGKPKYKTVKDAVEADQKEREADLKEHLEKNPEILEMKKADAEKAVAKYLEEKEKEEEAPVSPPSETAADELKSTLEKKKEQKGYGSISEAYEAGRKTLAERRRAAEKH